MDDAEPVRDQRQEQRLTALLSAYPPVPVDAARLAALGDRLETAFRRAAPRRAWWQRPTAWSAAAALLFASGGGLWWTLRALPYPAASLSAATPAIRIGENPQAPYVTNVAQVPTDTALHIDFAPAALQWDDGTTLELAAGSVLHLRDAHDGAKRLVLDHGHLSAVVAVQPAGKPLRITTPQSEAVVVGTAFTLESDALATRLAVTHGTVALRRPADAAPVLVSAGQTSVASQTVAPAARPLAAMALRNPSFELPLVEDRFRGWAIDTRNNDSTARLTSDTCVDGHQSLLLEQYRRIVWPPELAEHPDFQVFINGPNGGRGHISVSQHIPVIAGKTYAFSFAWRSQGLSREVRAVGPLRGYVKFAACLFWLRADGERSVPGREVLSTADDAAQWTTWPAADQAAFGRVVAPADAVSAAISFKLTTAVADRLPRVWIDRVGFAAE
jgi:hypothetical protein